MELRAGLRGVKYLDPKNWAPPNVVSHKLNNLAALLLLSEFLPDFWLFFGALGLSVLIILAVLTVNCLNYWKKK